MHHLQAGEFFFVTMKKPRVFWSEAARRRHINYLELLNLATNFQGYDILLRINNISAIRKVNRMDGMKYPHLDACPRE